MNKQYVSIFCGGLVLWATSVSAQTVPPPPSGLGGGDMRITGTMIGDIFSGIGSFGGGEVPVRDATVRSNTAIEVAKLILMLADMIKQAELDMPFPVNTTIAPMSAEITQLSRDPDALLYGTDIGTWDAQIGTVDHIWSHGDWVPASVDRDRHAIASMRHVGEMLHARAERLPADLHRAAGQNTAIAGATGRNQVLQAVGYAVVENTQQQLITQQLLMANANAQTVYNAHELNERAAREAQARAFFAPPPGARATIQPMRDVGL